jgi:hypothetical protein
MHGRIISASTRAGEVKMTGKREGRPNKRVCSEMGRDRMKVEQVVDGTVLSDPLLMDDSSNRNHCKSTQRKEIKGIVRCWSHRHLCKAGNVDDSEKAYRPFLISLVLNPWGSFLLMPSGSRPK